MDGWEVLLLAIGLLVANEVWGWFKDRSRLLTPHEINLRRAARPVGVAALATLAVFIFGARGVREGIADLLPYPLDNRLQAALLGLVLLYGTASFVIGARGCWGVRSERMLAPRAFLKLVIGLAVTVYLWRNYPWNLLAADDWAFTGLIVAFCAGLWWASTGATRFLLLTVGGGSALRRVNIHIQQTQTVMRPARRRAWWKFW